MSNPASAGARRGPKWKTFREDAMTDIKQAIRSELTLTGMSQADLAAYCGLSQKHVSRMLTGRVRGTFDVLAQMAAACGLTITAQNLNAARTGNGDAVKRNRPSPHAG